jgi:hypothetical protein
MRIPSWHVRGDWFDVCSCNSPCPCEFAQASTDNYCEGVLAYHINACRYGYAVLDGLNVVMVSRFTGDLWAGTGEDWEVGVFPDARADDAHIAHIGHPPTHIGHPPKLISGTPIEFSASNQTSHRCADGRTALNFRPPPHRLRLDRCARD